MTQEQMLLKRLRGLRARVRALFALHGAGRLFMVVPPAILLAVVLDYLLHFPWQLRALLLGGLVVLAGAVILRHLWRPLRVPITVDDVALELEGQFPTLDDRLATTVNFLNRPVDRGESKALRDAVVSDTLGTVSRMKLGSALRPRPLILIFLLGLLIAGAVSGLGVAYGSEAGIGLERLFNPLSDARWPKRNELRLDHEGRVAVAIGDNFTARALVAPGSEIPGRVIIYFREVGSDAFEHQVMERLSLPDGQAFTCRFTRVRKSFEYYVTGGDDRAPDAGVVTVDARPRPRVENILLTITPPEYVTGAEPVTIPGQGVTRALQGSMIRMDVVTNKAVGVDAAGAAQGAVLLGEDRKPHPLVFVAPEGTLADDASDEDRKLEQARAENAYLRAEFELEETTHFDFQLLCTDGFTSRSTEGTCCIEAEIDKAPRLRFEKPTQALMDVTAHAVVPVEVHVEDDYGVTRTALGWQRVNTEQKDVFGLSEYFIDKGAKERPLALWASRRWDLRDISPPLQEGEELVYRAVASDNFAWRGAEPHVGETPEYRLRVVSVKSKEDALVALLAALALRAGDLVERQEAVQAETKDTRAAKKPDELLSAKGREQTLTEESDERMLKRQTEDLRADFDDVLNEWRVHRIPQGEAFDHGKALREALDTVAKDPMPKASDALREARDAEATPQAQSEGLDTAIDEMQRVLDMLGEALAKLSKFAEAERIAQELKRILREQEEATERTKGHAAKTLGKSDSELTPEQRDAQRALETRQNELSKETKDVTRELKEKAERSEEQQADQAVSEVLKEAAREAENRDPARKMSRAASQIGENQSGSARQNQEGAEEDLKKIIEKIEERRVAELKERIKSLEQLKQELEELKKREEGHLQENRQAQEGKQGAPTPEQQAGKQEQTAKDTQQLAQKMDASQAGDATQSTQQAGQSMHQASSQLSQSQSQQAEQSQEKAIEKLDEARQQLEEEIEQARREQLAEELESLKEQLARIRDEEILVNKGTADFDAKKAADKLERSDYGKLAFNQDKQGELLNETGDVVNELEDAGVKVFKFALTIVVDRMAESDDRLKRKLTDAITQRAQEKAIYVLGQLVDALEEEIADLQKKDEDQQQGGGGGQQGQPQLVPTLAELKMLRLMQQDINQDTAKVYENVQETQKVTPEVEAEAKRIGRDQGKIKKLMEGLTDPNAGAQGGERI